MYQSVLITHISKFTYAHVVTVNRAIYYISLKAKKKTIVKSTNVNFSCDTSCMEYEYLVYRYMYIYFMFLV